MLTCLSWLSVLNPIEDNKLSKAVFKLWKRQFLFTQTYRFTLCVTIQAGFMRHLPGIFCF